MKLYRLIFILWLLPGLLHGQQSSDEKTDISLVLKQLSEAFRIEFSYLDELLEGKSIHIDSAWSLNESLQNLELATRLRFERLGEGYVLIRNYKDQDLISLCGYVSDHQGSPIIGTTVGYTERDGVFTDSEGYFFLDSIPYGSILTFRSIGFVTKKLTVANLPFNTCARIRMAESVNQLDEVVVNNYLAPGIHKVNNEVRLNPEELKTLAGLAEPDILQSIQQAPGVNSPYETAAGIHVRGGLPDQNLVLWNGIKTYNQGHFFGMISAFNPYVTKHVTFIKKGTPARYGDRVAAVIDIQTDDQVAQKTTGSVGSNLLYGDGYLNTPIIKNKLSLQLSGRRSFTDMVETITYQQMADRVFQNTKIEEQQGANVQSENRFYFNDFSSTLNYQVNTNNSLSISSLYNRNELDFTSSNASEESYNDKLLHANEGVVGTWKSTPSKIVAIEASANYAKYILRYDFTREVPDTTTISSKKNLVEDFSSHISGDIGLNDRGRLKLGYHYSNVHIQYAYETQAPSYTLILDSDNSTVQTHAGYVDYHYEHGKLLLMPGIRYNYYKELSNGIIEPRLFTALAISDKVTINSSAEYRTQVASQIKESVVSDLSLENKVWALASENRFPIVKSYQLTMGSSFKSHRWFFDVDGYHRQVRGVTSLIFGYLNPFDNQFRKGDSRIFGADAFVKKVYTNYESWISYSYINTSNTFSGLNNDRPFPGSWNIEHTVRWSHIYRQRDWEFSLGWVWHTGKSYTEVQEANNEGALTITYSDINGNNLPDYHRLDIAVMREFKSKRSSLRYRLGLSLLNVYNRRNLLNREFRTTPSLNNELIDTRVYSLAITPNVVFRMFW